jgi:hypothetical protein
MSTQKTSGPSLGVKVGGATKGLGVVHSNKRIDVAVPAAARRSGPPVVKGSNVVPVTAKPWSSVGNVRPKAGRKPNTFPTQR